MSCSLEDIEVAHKGLDAAFEAVAALSYDVLTVSEKKNLLVRLEAHRRRLPAVEHPLISLLVTEAAPEVLGGTSLVEVLATALRISKAEAKRRVAEARDLGPRTTLAGESLEPLMPTTAAAQADGVVGAENVEVIRNFFMGRRCDPRRSIRTVGRPTTPKGRGKRISLSASRHLTG
jgi:hypothetical protein